MEEEKIPKIFISYSWKTENFVSDLARRLCSDRVDVVWDKWDLKPGQDIYKFMEKSVNDLEVSKVLLICDKTYKEKADNRTGGVGSETLIISSEIYNNVEQEKFIPIIIEKDDSDKPFIPTFIKSRFYIDFSEAENYEIRYEELLRNIYNKPKYSKPKLGKRPDWLDEDKVNYFPLKDSIKQIKGSNNDKKKNYCISKFEYEYIEALKEFYIKNTTPQQAYENFCNMKYIRDIYLDFLVVIVNESDNFAEELCSFFENLYNSLTSIKFFDPNSTSSNNYDFDIFYIHIWELFLLTITYLRHIQDYKSINLFLTHTYFFDYSGIGGRKLEPGNYSIFDYRGEIIECVYKPTTERKNRFSLLADDLYHTRLKLPIFTSDNIAESDLFLYQVSQALNVSSWFPALYVYVKETPKEWIKIKSKKYCQKHLFSLLGVNSIDELKLVIANCKSDMNFRYPSSFDIPPTILYYIKIEEIGCYN